MNKKNTIIVKNLDKTISKNLLKVTSTNPHNGTIQNINASNSSSISPLNNKSKLNKNKRDDSNDKKEEKNSQSEVKYENMINKMFSYLKDKVSSEIYTDLKHIVKSEEGNTKTKGNTKGNIISNSINLENIRFNSSNYNLQNNSNINRNPTGTLEGEEQILTTLDNTNFSSKFSKISRNEKSLRQSNGICINPPKIEETNEEGEGSFDFKNKIEPQCDISNKSNKSNNEIEKINTKFLNKINSNICTKAVDSYNILKIFKNNNNKKEPIENKKNNDSNSNDIPSSSQNNLHNFSHNNSSSSLNLEKTLKSQKTTFLKDILKISYNKKTPLNTNNHNTYKLQINCENKNNGYTSIPRQKETSVSNERNNNINISKNILEKNEKQIKSNSIQNINSTAETKNVNNVKNQINIFPIFKAESNASKLKFLASNSVSKSNSKEKIIKTKYPMGSSKISPANIKTTSGGKTINSKKENISTIQQSFNNVKLNPKLSKKLNLSPSVEKNEKVKTKNENINISLQKSNTNSNNMEKIKVQMQHVPFPQNKNNNLNNFMKQSSNLQKSSENNVNSKKLSNTLDFNYCNNLNTSLNQKKDKLMLKFQSRNNQKVKNKPKYSEISIDNNDTTVNRCPSNFNLLIPKRNTTNLKNFITNTSGRETYASNGSLLQQETTKRQFSTGTKRIMDLTYNLSMSKESMREIDGANKALLDLNSHQPGGNKFISVVGEKLNSTHILQDDDDMEKNQHSELENRHLIKEIKMNLDNNLKNLFNFSYENFMKDLSESNVSDKFFEEIVENN
jgi:hypothetical protein